MIFLLMGCPATSWLGCTAKFSILAKHAAIEVPHVKRETHLLFGLGHFSIPVQSFRIKTKSRNILLCLEIPYLQFPITITIQVFKNLAIYFLNKLTFCAVWQEPVFTKGPYCHSSRCSFLCN